MKRGKTEPHRRVGVGGVGGSELRQLQVSRMCELEAELAEKTRQCELLQTGTMELSAACSKLTEMGRLKDEAMSIAAHELKSPLTTVKGYLGLTKIAAKGKADCETCRRNITVMEVQIRKITGLVNRLLDSHRIQMGGFALHRRSMDLISLIEPVVEQLRLASPNHSVEVETDLVQLEGEWDAERLEEVISNLLENAVKYSPDGGLVRVRVQAASGVARVSVSDQGIGVPSADIPRLFEVYSRASNAQESGILGLGIGLYVSKQIVTQHGGRMWLDSELGKGSSFHFELPLG